jgi:thiol-disulfide isomerase/thioredoxin
MKKTISLVVGSVLGASLVLAAPPPPAVAHPARVSAIQPGDRAPPLFVAEWIKGDPVSLFEPGKVYLVEYWAVWCGPCIANIPHLNALQKKYGAKGLIVIGMTTPDREADYTGPRREGNSLAMVRDFVANRGAAMNYRVAYDAPGRETYKAYMGQRSGIPHAFLFDRRGRLVIDGHPNYMDDAIAQVLAGTWDPVNGPARIERAQQAFIFALNARKYETFTANYGELAREFSGAAKRLFPNRFLQALRAGDLAGLADAGDNLIAQAGELGDPRELAASVRNAARELSGVLNSGAGGLVPAERVQAVRALLGRMTEAAARGATGREPAVFAAQAELAFADGQLAEAVALQEKAVAAILAGAKGGDVEQRRLDELRKAFSDRKRQDELRRVTGRPE